MIRAKRLMITVANVITSVAVGICYVQLLRSALSLVASHFPQALSSPEKMTQTGIAAVISIALVFTFNRLVTRQNMLGLGLSCGAMAFIYFYIVRAWPHLYAAYLALFHVYSLFAMLAFTVAPVVVGALWHRRRQLSGLHLLLSQRQ